MRRVPLICLIALACVPAAVAGRKAHAPSVFVIEGRGWGHGIGMSQWGAEGFASHGWTYAQILAYYYPGTRLARHGRARVRVLLGDGRSHATISSSEPFRVDGHRLSAGRYGVGPDLRVRLHGKWLHLKAPLRFDPGAAPLSVDDAPYRGSLVLFASGGGVGVVNVVSLDDYVRGVVPWEMPFWWRRNALQAQAVAARSYALATLDPGARFDEFADTRSQEYGGIRAERPATNAAVAATAGQVLTWRGSVARTYYFSTSGGRTEAGSAPYLPSVGDPYDVISPHHTWGPVVVRAHALAQKLGLRCVPTLAVVAGPSGRVSEVRATCPKRGTRTISGSDFESRLGLRSTWFSVTDEPANAAPPPLAPQGAPTPPRVPGLARRSSGVWPAGKHGWTVVLDSLPESAAPEAKQDLAAARKAGVPEPGILRSSDFRNLTPGLLVVFSGVYKSAQDATAAANALHQGYPREIVP